MSIRATTLIWDKATHYSRGQLLVLLVLADWSDDEGLCSATSVQIAKKCRLSERRTEIILNELRMNGVISVTLGGFYKLNDAFFRLEPTRNSK